MGDRWINRQTNNYAQNFLGVNAIDPPYDTSYMLNNLGDFRSRAYVNPSIVNCAVAYSGANNVAVPKRIHINPNFKGRRTFLQNDKPQESNSVHINPYFGRSKVNSPGNEQLQHSRNKLKHIVTGGEKRSNESNNEKLVKRSTGQGNIVPEGCSSDNNSSCVQFTKTASSPCSTSNNSAVNMPSLQSKSQANKINIFRKSLNIKTKHKIVHVDNFKTEVRNNENSKRKLLNRYKLINVVKSEIVNEKSSKSYVSGRRKTLTSNLQLNSVKQEREQVLAGNLQILKLKHILKRNSCINRITNSIKTKYIYPSKTMWHRKRPMNLLQNSKHKLDKRGMISETCFNQKKLSEKTLSQHRAKTASCLWKLSLNKHKYHNHFIWRKHGKLKNDRQRIKKTYPNRTVVKIGGIMYKSSSNKLTLTKDKKREARTGNATNFVASKMRHQIVYVRGEKFLLDSSGKTLVRQPKVVNASDGGEKCFLRRIDLGGVTFVEKSKNVLIRTNTHHARQLVHSAKQRSIALLHHLHKRNNMPCLIYQRFGICRRQKNGMCIYVHDPKNIDLCKKFLKGECQSNNCSLSHNAVKEKMATCHFFLKGKCNKENCQYLHVKVNKKATICRDFLQGFCTLGQNCSKRHVHRCPEYDEKGACSRGVNCPYPHKRKSKSLKRYKINKFELTAKSGEEKDSANEKLTCKTVKRNSLRSKCEISKKRKMKSEVRRLETDKTDETGNDSIVECIPKRVKLTDLPLFIPLNTK